MQHQRAIVMMDETIIDQGERVQLEVNSAMAGKSRPLSGEPSAALTKSCSRSCGAPEAGTYTPWTILCCPVVSGLWLWPPCCPPCPYLPDGAGRRAPLRGVSCVEGAFPAGCARCLAPEPPQCWERGLAGHCCSGDAAWVFSLAARLMYRWDEPGRAG